MPPPQSASHFVQFAHSPKAQSRGQKCVLHSRRSTAAGHFLPPARACCTMVFFRTCVPPPHEREHSPQPLVWKTQFFGGCVGQGGERQSLRCAVALHVPPKAACNITLRARTLPPMPHVAVQGLHVDQSASLQSTGQGKALHATSAASTGQARPPWAAARLTTRVQFLVPPPQ